MEQQSERRVKDVLLRLSLDKTTISDITKTLEGYKNGAGKAIRMAINDTIRIARTRLTDTVADELNLKRGDILNKFDIKKATLTNLSGSVRLRRAQVDLSSFKDAKQIKGGVRVTVRKSKGSEFFPHYFINRGTSTGRKHVLSRRYAASMGDATEWKQKTKDGFIVHRVTKSNKTGLVGRYPIRIRYGKTIIGYLTKEPGLLDSEMAAIQTDFLSRLDSKVKGILSGAIKL